MDNLKLSETEQNQKVYYNRIAEEYDLHYGSKESITYRNDLFDSILKGIDLRGLKALDAMCGGGQSSAYLTSRQCVVTGLDLSEEQCQFYKNRFPNNEVFCRSILDTGFEDHYFDIIVIDSLHHLHPYVNKGIIELTRVLKPGGLLLIWEPSQGSLFDLARQLWYKLDSNYFQSNEAAISLDRIKKSHSLNLELKKAVYGGNLAYLLVFLSMALRIPQHIVKFYASPVMKIEKQLAKLQTRFTSLWVLALLRRK